MRLNALMLDPSEAHHCSLGVQILAYDDAMVALKGFESELLLRLDALRLELLNLVCKHLRGWFGRVNAVGFDAL